MLTVNREDLAAAANQLGDDRATGDQTFLVGQGKAVTRLQRGDRRPQTCRADHCVDDDGARLRRQCGDEIIAESHPGAEFGESGALRGGGSSHRHPGGGVGNCQVPQLVGAAPCRQRRDLCPESGGDLEGLAPDRSRGAEDRDRFHPSSPVIRYSSHTAGTTNKNPSMRSRTPP